MKPSPIVTILLIITIFVGIFKLNSTDIAKAYSSLPTKLSLINEHPHKCEYLGCPFKDKTHWEGKGCSGCEPGSDCYIFDSLHFAMPDKSYEQLDSIFSLSTKPVSLTDKFYDGEGNEISIQDVQLLVKSQFVEITNEEQKRLGKIFYANNLAE